MMASDAPTRPAAELFGGVLPDKRATQSSHKIVDFNAKQVTGALKAEATSLQALHVYLFKSLKDLEVERTCLESLRHAVASGQHTVTEGQQPPPRGATAQQPACTLDPCSRLTDCLLPVDAPITDADIAAAGATAAPSALGPTLAAAAAHAADPPERHASRGAAARSAAPGRRAAREDAGCGRGVKRQRGARPARTARAAGSSGAGRQVAPQAGRAARRMRGTGTGGKAAGGGGGGGGGGRGRAGAGGGVPVTFEEFLGTSLSHEALLAQLDVAQDILGLDDDVAGGDAGVCGGADAAAAAAVSDADTGGGA
eukprot:jgi/Ulvmu1/11367/UM075_0029.1